MLKKIVSLLSFALLSGALLTAPAYAQEKPGNTQQEQSKITQQEFKVSPAVIQKMTKKDRDKDTYIKTFFLRAGVHAWEDGRSLTYDEANNLLIVKQDEWSLNRIGRIITSMTKALASPKSEIVVVDARIIPVNSRGGVVASERSPKADATKRETGSSNQEPIKFLRREFKIRPDALAYIMSLNNQFSQALNTEEISADKASLLKCFFFRSGIHPWEGVRSLTYDEARNVIIVDQDERSLNRIEKIINFIDTLTKPETPSPRQATQHSYLGETALTWEKAFPDGLIKAGEKANKAKKDTVKTLKGKFVAVYNSASWCGPCRMFTPELVKFYKKNQKQIEIVFKSADKSEEAMIAYAKKNKMKWLAIPFGKRCTTKSANGIPHFVVYTPDGELFTEISGAGEKSKKALEALSDGMKEWYKEHKKR